MPRPRPEGPQLKLRRGKWEIVFWDDEGARHRLSTGATDDRSARQALEDFLRRDRAPRGSDAYTVTQALSDYLADRKTKVIALTRLQECAKAIERHIGHLRLDQIDQHQWDRYVRNRVTLPRKNVKAEDHKPQPVADGTLKREFNVLRATLGLAYRRGVLVTVPRIEPPHDSEPRDRYLTKDEARRLLAACKSQHVRTFVALAIYTGARRGAILTLTWDRVDFDSGMVDFREPGRRITVKRRNVVPMGFGLRQELEDAHKVRVGDHVVEWNGEPVPFGLRWSWGRLCTNAGLTWTPTPHHLKHSVASWMAMAGIPIDQAADWLATDPKTLRRVYRKFDPTYLRPLTKALEL